MPEKSATAGTVKSLSIPRHWVPPPALSSPGKRTQNLHKLRHKRSLTDVKAPLEAPKSSEFNVKLEELLDEIRQMKTHDFSRLPDELWTAEQEKSILQKSLNVVREELMRNVSEKAVLTERHSKLIEKLRRVEEDASDAVRHVVSLREFVQELSRDGTRAGLNEEAMRSTRKEMMEKLVRLDDANRSLQNLIQSGSIEVQPIPSPPSDRGDFQVERLTSEIKVLQEQLEEDRREILGLRKSVIEVGSRSAIERESLKNEVSVHRERANNYLSVIDSIKFELNEKDQDVRKLHLQLESVQLKIEHLTRENETLIVDKSTLQSKLRALESQMRSDEANLRLRSDEVTSKFHQMSSKATLLEVENDRLKLQFAGAQDVIAKQKGEILLLNVTKDSKRTLGQNKSVQVCLGRSELQPNKTGCDRMPPFSETVTYCLDESKWIKVTELWQIVQNEKAVIMKQLRDLELKLEKSEVANAEFKKELLEKEEKLRQNNLQLQEKVKESNSLKELLESALRDVRRFDEEAKKNSISFNNAMQSRLSEMEKVLQHYKAENDQLTTHKDKLEQQVEDLQKSGKSLRDYVTFLRTSYANVFGGNFAL